MPLPPRSDTSTVNPPKSTPIYPLEHTGAMSTPTISSSTLKAREAVTPGALDSDASDSALSEDSATSTVICDLTAHDDALCTVSPVALPLSDFISTKENTGRAANSLAVAFDNLHVTTPKCHENAKEVAESNRDKRRIEFNLPCTPAAKPSGNGPVPKSLYKTPFERSPKSAGSNGHEGEDDDDDILFHTAFAHKTRSRVVSSDDEERPTLEAVKPRATDFIDLSNSTDSSSSEDKSPVLRRRLQTPFKHEVHSVLKIRKQVQDMKFETEVVDILDDSDDDSSYVDTEDDDFLSVGSSKKPGTKYTTRVEDIGQDSELLDDDNRGAFVEQLLQLFNRAVFNNAIPANLEVKWNMRLTKTAGVTYTSVQAGERVCRIELSTKVVDTFYRLKTTFLHECCHVAAWMVQGSNKPPHGTRYVTTTVH